MSVTQRTVLNVKRTQVCALDARQHSSFQLGTAATSLFSIVRAVRLTQLTARPAEGSASTHQPQVPARSAINTSSTVYDVQAPVIAMSATVLCMLQDLFGYRPIIRLIDAITVPGI